MKENFWLQATVALKMIWIVRVVSKIKICKILQLWHFFFRKDSTMSKANFFAFQGEFITKLDLLIGEAGFGDPHFLMKFKTIMKSNCESHTSIRESGRIAFYVFIFNPKLLKHSQGFESMEKILTKLSKDCYALTHDKWGNWVCVGR